MFTILTSLIEGVVSLLSHLTEIVFSHIGYPGYPKTSFEPHITTTRAVLKRKNKGFCIDGIRSLSEQHSFRGALIVGATGTGKTSTTIIPSVLKLARFGHSLVINDPSTEIHEKTAAFLHAQDYDIRLLSFGRPQTSDGFNPLLRIKSQADVGKISETLVSSGLVNNGTGDPFWESQAKGLLSLCMEILLHADPRFRNMANLIHVLNHIQHDSRELQAMARRAGPRVHSEFVVYANLPERVLSGTVATAKAALGVFHNEDIQKVTSFDSIQIESLRGTPTAIFVQNPIMSGAFFAPLCSIFFSQLFDSLMQEIPKQRDRSVFCLIDEAATFTAQWGLYLSQVRKYRVGIMLALQALDQFKSLYSPYEASSIVTNCFARLFFTGQEHHAAKELSDSLGWLSKEGEGSGPSPLMTPQEIRQIDSRRALLFAGNKPPMMAKLRPCYKSRLKRCIGPAPHRPLRTSINIPLLDL